MNENVISVILSVYNGEKYVREAIESILTQTYTNFEFIIVNDGSTDSTQQIINEYLWDSRIKLIKQDNLGLTKSLNKAILQAKGDYIARQDADDFSHATRLAKQLEVLRKNDNVFMVTSDFDIINRDGTFLIHRTLPPEKVIKKILPIENRICHGSVMFRKKVFFCLGMYDVSQKYNQDKFLWLKMIKHGLIFKVIHETLYFYRISYDNLIFTKLEKKPKHKFNTTDKEIYLLYRVATILLQDGENIKARKKIKSLFFCSGKFIRRKKFFLLMFFALSFLPSSYTKHIFLTIRIKLKKLIRVQTEITKT